MKITVEAVFATQFGTGVTTYLQKVYLNDEFMGYLGFMGKLEFEAEQGENELKFVDGQYNKVKKAIKFTATEDVYFWTALIGKPYKAIKDMPLEIDGKGKDYKLISESKE